MSFTSDLLNTEREPKNVQAEEGERTVHRVTFFPSSANPGDTISVVVPLLSRDMVFVPKSLFLRFNIEIDMGDDKNHLVFNVSRNLVDTFKVKVGTHTITDIKRYDLYKGFHDLLQVGEDMMLGVTTSLKRKIRSNTSDKSTNGKYVKHCNAYGKTYHIPLSHPILDDYGFFNSRALRDKFEFEITLAKKEEIVVTTDLSKAHSFKLNNIELEYTSMKNIEVMNHTSTIYNGERTFSLEDVNLFMIEGPIKFSTQKTIRARINMSVDHMKGVLFLFTKEYTAGARNTEEFINPLISNVDVTIDSVTHLIYSRGIKSTDMWKLILKKVGEVHKNFDEHDFLDDKYGLWVDLRAAQDNMMHGDGKKLGRSDGLVIEITSESVEASNVNCYIYTVSDSAAIVRNGRVTEYIK